MIKGVMLASMNFEGIFSNLLSQWEQSGMFSYLLPFLLIFAIIFGILTKVKIFKENKAVNAIIALVVALMSLQFSIVSEFFSEIFPRLGIGLAIILVIMILVGLFTDPESNFINYLFLGVSIIIVIVILIQTAGSLGWQSGNWWAENWGSILGILVILGFIVAVIIGGSRKEKKDKNPRTYVPMWTKND